MLQLLNVPCHLCTFRNLKMKMMRRILSSILPPRTNTRLVGEDQYGNKYYEVERENGKNRRYVELKGVKPEDYAHGMIPIQWEGWIRGSNKDPPTLKELQDEDILRQSIKKKAAEIKRKDDEAQRKAYEEVLISPITDSPKSNSQKTTIGHASAPVFEKTEQVPEPKSVGGVLEPGSWIPKSKEKREPLDDDDATYEPESWKPKSQTKNQTS